MTVERHLLIALQLADLGYYSDVSNDRVVRACITAGYRDPSTAFCNRVRKLLPDEPETETT